LNEDFEEWFEYVFLNELSRPRGWQKNIKDLIEWAYTTGAQHAIRQQANERPL
jgi:hypothetical protein